MSDGDTWDEFEGDSLAMRDEIDRLRASAWKVLAVADEIVVVSQAGDYDSIPHAGMLSLIEVLHDLRTIVGKP